MTTVFGPDSSVGAERDLSPRGGCLEAQGSSAHLAG
jgi:hypothetical protein